MMKSACKRLIALIAGTALLGTTIVSVANAAMVGTQSGVAMEQRAEYASDIKDWLAQENVKKQLVELGVDPSSASERVAAMTTEELRILHSRIGELPAGAGAIEVIGLVFLVLLILEIVGVTNIFNKI